jgi:hypothetical protein
MQDARKIYFFVTGVKIDKAEWIVIIPYEKYLSGFPDKSVR